MFASLPARAALLATCFATGIAFGALLLGVRPDSTQSITSDAATLTVASSGKASLNATLVEHREILAIDGDEESQQPRETQELQGPTQAQEPPQMPTSTTEVTATPAQAAPPADQRPLVIFDTDMGPDIDDALALAMLHNYERQGAIELAAVTLSRPSNPGAKYIDALNTFYGRPNLEVGMYRGDTVDAFDDRNLFVSEADQWPHDLDPNAIPEGYRVQRKILDRAIAEGRSVILIQTGFSGNAAALLRSGHDDISNQSGRDLIANSGVLLSIMAGSFDRNHVEFNVKKDLSSAQELINGWPNDMIVSPFELGYRITYPYSSIQRDFDWVDRHPIRESYEFRDLDWHEDAPPFYNMRSWDLTSVMVAIEPDADYFPISSWGTVHVDGSGLTTFAEGNGRARILHRSNEYSAEQKQRIINRMIELTSARP